MTSLPITRMTLDQHGVGFFERRVPMSGKKVELSFPVESMNDVLKSLSVIDRDGRHVLGIDYATPKSRKEQLAACAIRLGNDRSLRDLLVGLRGRRRLLCRSSSPMTGTSRRRRARKLDAVALATNVTVLMERGTQKDSRLSKKV